MNDHQNLRQLCVFCGSSPGTNPRYRDVAGQLGQLLATKEIRLVYGGGGIGLMGALADSTLAAGGQVIGIIPTGLATREVAHPHLTELEVVGTMHERKARMADLADAFLALPGGMGTFDELFEIITWAQLGIHRKPIGLLNIDHYFDPLIEMVEHAVREGFVSPHHRGLLIIADSVEDWFTRLAAYQPLTDSTRWIEMRDI
jgi:uncharacterized protein (TIGR00730 family)